MIKYRVYHGQIQARKVTRESEYRIGFMNDFFGGMREEFENKVSAHRNWFDTWDEAHAFLLERTDAQIKTYRVKLEGLEETLEKIKSMEEPDD